MGRSFGRILMRTGFMAATLYLAFVAVWGLNYRRVPLTEKLRFDSSAVTLDGARALAATAVERLNASHRAAHAIGWPPGSEATLEEAFRSAQRVLGASRLAVAGRPKRTMLDLYLRRASVEGMTGPYFLETLVASRLLPFERTFVVAHEWAHLAGFADESEANFVGVLTCLGGDEAARYSAWLFLYSQVSSGLPREDRSALGARLADGPRADLRAIADRVGRDVNPRVAAAGWRVYDQYLKANRVEAGTASYAEVVKLILGTPLGARAIRP
jgi:hypothetical protein